MLHFINKVKTILLFSLLFLVIGFNLKATHLVIGELSYVKTNASTNEYEITLTYYRDCRPQSQGGGNIEAMLVDDPAYISIFNGTTLFSFDSVQHAQIEFLSVPSDCRLNSVQPKCISKITFKLNKILPPSNLPYLIINQRCCLNETIQNVTNPGNTGFSFSTTIPPVGNISNAIFEPVYSNILCIHDKVTIDHSAVDADGDSLSYELCDMPSGAQPSNSKPLILSYPSISNIAFSPGYWATQPMQYVNIDPNTGLLTIDAQQVGNFLVCVCCHEWRNGVIINTSRRAFIYQVGTCDLIFNASIQCDPYVMQFSNSMVCNALCTSNLTVQFKNTSIGQSTYLWDFGVDGISTDTSTQISPIYQYPSSGYYTVTLVANKDSCSDETKVKIYIGNETVTGDFQTGPIICAGLPVQLEDLSIGQPDTIQSVHWYLNNGIENHFLTGKDTSLLFTSGGDVNILHVAFNAKGCYDSTHKNIWMPTVDVMAYQDTTIPLNTAIQLYATGADTYLWTKLGTNGILSGQQDATMVPSTDQQGITNYFVLGTNADGCLGRDSVRVTVTSSAMFIVPTAFSPNSDGNNDFLSAIHSGYTLQKFLVYNRWGQQVFQSSDINFKWNGEFKGKSLTMDSYYWLANVQTTDGKKETKKGDFVIVR